MTGKSTKRMSSGKGNKIVIPGYVVADIEGSFHNEVKVAQLMLHPQAVPREFGATSYWKMEHLTKDSTKTIDKNDQNGRRFQAMNDGYNATSRVIMWKVMTKSLGCNILDALHFSTDKSSHYLNAPTKQILLSALGIKEELHGLHRTVTATKTGKEEKARGFAYTPVTSMAGGTLAWTTHITDHTFNEQGEVRTYKLTDRRFMQTIPTGPKPSVLGPLHGVAASASVPAASSSAAAVDCDDDAISGTSIVNVSTVVGEVEKSLDELEEERLAELLRNKYGAQEAEQYIKLIYLPVMLAARKQRILDDFYTQTLATVPMNAASLNSPFMGFASQEALEIAADVVRLEQTAKYRILATIDGERNGNDCLKRLYGERRPVSQDVPNFPETAEDNSSAREATHFEGCAC
jgi:hypothetical protein